MFFYVKNAHLGKVPGIEEYVTLFLAEKMVGPKGLLKSLGLTPSPEAQREAARVDWEKREKLTLAQIEE